MEITRSAKKAVKRSEKLAKIAKGEKTGGKKDKAIKAIGKKFYKNVSVGVWLRSAFGGAVADRGTWLAGARARAVLVMCS